jgi:hypothetical protein
MTGCIRRSNFAVQKADLPEDMVWWGLEAEWGRGRICRIYFGVYEMSGLMDV